MLIRLFTTSSLKYCPTLEKATAKSAASYSAEEVTVLIPRSNTKFLPWSLQGGFEKHPLLSHPPPTSQLCSTGTQQHKSHPQERRGSYHLLDVCLAILEMHTPADCIKLLWKVGDTASHQLERQNILRFLTNQIFFSLQ